MGATAPSAGSWAAVGAASETCEAATGSGGALDPSEAICDSNSIRLPCSDSKAFLESALWLFPQETPTITSLEAPHEFSHRRGHSRGRTTDADRQSTRLNSSH